jgi:hypothetical protein
VKRASFIAAVILLCATPALHARDAGVVILHSEPLQNLTLDRGEARDLADGLRRYHTRLAFDALGRRFDVELEPNTRLISAGLLSGLEDEVGLYRGRLAGKPGSWVRIVITDGVPTGLVWDGAEMLAIDKLTGSRDASIYRLEDTYVEPGMMGCGTGDAQEATLATAYSSVTSELDAAFSQAPGAVDELKIGMVADYEFSSRAGASAEADMLTRMNNVDGIFSEQLGVQITVDFVEVFTEADDPFTSSVPDELLVELSNYRFATQEQRSRGLTFLFTGRDLEGRITGIAYLDVLCETRYGAGLAQGNQGVATDSLIAAHELGHNFGAEHDGEAGSVCATEIGDYLMSATVNDSGEFSSCSIDTIRPRIAAASCINPLPRTDVAIGLVEDLPEFLIGGRIDLVFDVTNLGSEEAANTAATFNVPTNLTLDSVATTAGSCDSGAGLVSCSLGAISGGGNVQVALSVVGNTVGSGTLDVSVTADEDVNLDDNARTYTVDVGPASDIRVTNVTTQSVALNSSLTINPRVENVSLYEANDVRFSVLFGPGLRIDSATWPDGTCTIGSGSVDCQRSSLAAQSNVTVEISLTATGSGAQLYTASVSSLEADANADDNSVTGTVNVTTSSVSSSDDSESGGGAMNLLWMLLAVLMRRRAARSR